MPLLFYYYKFFKKDEFNRLFDAFLYEGEGNIYIKINRIIIVNIIEIPKNFRKCALFVLSRK